MTAAAAAAAEKQLVGMGGGGICTLTACLCLFIVELEWLKQVPKERKRKRVQRVERERLAGKKRALNANVKAISQPKAGWKNQRLKNNAARWNGGGVRCSQASQPLPPKESSKRNAKVKKMGEKQPAKRTDNCHRFYDLQTGVESSGSGSSSSSSGVAWHRVE